MDDYRFNKLIEKLDNQISRLEVSHPVPNPMESPRSIGFIITKDMDLDKLTKEQLSMSHTMLHMFYHNKSGSGLSKKSIEKLHNEVSQRLKVHKKFDGLDKNGWFYKNRTEVT